MCVVYGTFQVAALTTFGVVWITLQIINGPNIALLGRGTMTNISPLESPPALLEGNPSTTDQSPHSSPMLVERSQLSEIVANGYKLIMEKYQVVVDAAEAYDTQRNMYEKIAQTTDGQSRFKDFVHFGGNLVITYGASRMQFDNLPTDPNTAREAVRQFALGLLRWVTLGAVYTTFQAVVATANAVIEVALVIREDDAAPLFITGGPIGR